MSDVEKIATQILREAAQIGGRTWNEIRKSASFYIRGYAQSLVDIASGVASGDITKKDGVVYTRNAFFMLAQGIANTAQVILFEVQNFLNRVLSILKGAINSALPIAIL
ncbi:hypothetical protein KXR53_04990 [Inquilinus limosus]|uniref:hypothetical protein n=1 Tax=Inquilinus limosus TaxID=171674 RepID=UPI003F1769E5